MRLFLLVLCISAQLLNSSMAIGINDESINLDQLDLREPSRSDIEKHKSTSEPVDPSGMSEFAAAPFKLKTSIGQVPIKTRLRMEVESPLSASSASIGDNFKARVLDDFFISSKSGLKKLIVPKDSWIRGKVSTLKKPRFLSRAGKLGIKLDSLMTPQGDYVPLDADLSFQLGVVNKDGLLDPQTGFGDKAMAPTNNLLDSTAGKAVSIATAGVPVVGTLLAGSVIALFSRGDGASVYKGQELQIVITQNTDLAY